MLVVGFSLQRLARQPTCHLLRSPRLTPSFTPTPLFRPGTREELRIKSKSKSKIKKRIRSRSKSKSKRGALEARARFVAGVGGGLIGVGDADIVRRSSNRRKS